MPAASTSPTEPQQVSEKRTINIWYPEHILCFLEEYRRYVKSFDGNKPKRDILWWENLVEIIHAKFVKEKMPFVRLDRTIAQQKLKSWKECYRVRHGMDLYSSSSAVRCTNDVEILSLLP